MKETNFKKYIKRKIIIYAFKKLLHKQSTSSKGTHINYGSKFKLQPYLTPNSVLSVIEQQKIFSYRSRMNDITYNFSNMKILQHCICSEVLSNEHLYNCENLKEYPEENKPEYNRILNGNIHEQKIIQNIMEEKYQLYIQYSQRST